MPIYEYECPKCGKFDVLQKMSAPPLEVHDVCGSKVKKLMSASSFAFKGSGFYITDYGGKSAAAITHHDKAPEKKAEQKPAACASCPANKSAA
ncbi:FmdB family zinc ribbon protein [Anaeromyxobacter oryzisoli]|jgi:putative FmdB family regulatory protein|uniref:FmdB family zinc ribbon protein n=1 Tax=Anaeromyxobacter oryzisoli TaxID=2925408 RepID=UPI001F57CC50|nr:FmdB family zinc ribbon protein [Anaeromyxobacter sp. SG63]